MTLGRSSFSHDSGMIGVDDGTASRSCNRPGRAFFWPLDGTAHLSLEKCTDPDRAVRQMQSASDTTARLNAGGPRKGGHTGAINALASRQALFLPALSNLLEDNNGERCGQFGGNGLSVSRS